MRNTGRPDVHMSYQCRAPRDAVQYHKFKFSVDTMSNLARASLAANFPARVFSFCDVRKRYDIIRSSLSLEGPLGLVQVNLQDDKGYSR